MLIVVEKDAALHVAARTGAMVIRMNFEPSLNGCSCSATRLTGSHVPQVNLGRPSEDEAAQYGCQLVEGVEVHVPLGLDLKQGSGELRIRLKGFLGMHWLEVDGAKGVASYCG